MVFVEGFSFKMTVFPFSRGKNRISQDVEHRGSLTSVPVALRVMREVLSVRPKVLL